MSKKESTDTTAVPSNVINLQALIPSSEQLTAKTAWVVFKGIKFQIRYISKVVLGQLAEQCVVTAYDAKARGRTRQLDPDKFTKELAKTLVRDWSEATLRNLRHIMPLNSEGLTEEQLDTELPFSQENLLTVVTSAHELDSFLQECSVDAGLFQTDEQENLRKN